MANRWSTQFFGTLEKKPFQIACNFVVDSTNGNGLGIRSLKGPGIANVFMHTSATVAVGNPNPLAGYIMVQFQDNYNRYLFGTAGFVSPLSGSNISISTGSSLTLGTPYVIVSLGTTTAVQWNAVGMPVGIVPAVGVAFIAKATSGTGSGIVQSASVSGITSVEVIGDPNKTVTSQAATVLGFSSGAYMLLQCLNGSGAVTAPANGSVIGLSFFMSNSSITVQGQ